MGEESPRERIIEVATRLFAELGFDGTTGGMIAEAAGVDAATMMELTGGTLQLYHTIMRRAHEAERAMLEDVAITVPLTLQGLHDFFDAYLDFHLSHPHIPRLWLHRWLGDAAGSADLEAQYHRPLTNLVGDAVRPLMPPSVDVDYMLWTLVWTMTGFVTYGVPGDDDTSAGWRGTTPLPHGHRTRRTPEAVDRFRSHLHMLIDSVLTAAAGVPPVRQRPLTRPGG
ncbi:TetR/AcrR family transcriptional regulator [Actinomadura latina]|uniref:TetR/AcrR family transcriptional regulator n=1 Tax=Actinomadura latina TaxID=163603 RepID=A0A846YXH5_9ACTN|nr:TetR/AcrR family transcriptional regulator [Actinomadura latina]NKZ02813.1 TetR/AcrR family transcriptional regulator [Actinomadura latina]